ncbi:TraQ conjugal transfer family protein [uncultured Porphyromonas sp.]|uniref:TraQ conjugal transfer family protein n=1 Tax=uncultured Porphyromonas sp. TaxID=159274 RepID=UPI002622A3EC|nr:TraQ conjugal transfer family protein [uncultured Porphyromonas sp.]
MNRYFILPLLLAILLGACSREVDVQEVYPFEVEVMPYHQDATRGQAVEVRCKLTPQKLFVARKYYIRKFQRSGKGSLLLNVGGVELADNDNYDLAVGNFRLYYTPEEGSQHTVELVVSDDAGQEQSLLLEFKLSDNLGGGGDTPSPDEDNIPPIGDVAQGENGNYYINGVDTGIAIKPAHKPVVTIVDGYYYIDGVKTPVPAPPAPVAPQYPDGVLVPTLKKQGKYEVLLISKAPEVTYTDPATNEKRKVIANGVRIEDGACLYQCLSPDSVPVPFATVSGLPRIPDKSYQTDKNGCFVVPASDLPVKGLPETGVTKSIIINGKQYSSDKTTYVPSRMIVKLIYSHHEGSKFYFRLTQWDSEKNNGTFVPLVTPLDGAVYGNPRNFILWATRDKAKGIGVKADYAALKHSIAYGTSDGFIVVILPNVSISDPSLPDYERKDRKPLFLMLGMMRSPYSDQPIRTLQLLGMAEKSFWDSITDFFTPFE